MSQYECTYCKDKGEKETNHLPQDCPRKPKPFSEYNATEVQDWFNAPGQEDFKPFAASFKVSGRSLSGFSKEDFQEIVGDRAMAIALYNAVHAAGVNSLLSAGLPRLGGRRASASSPSESVSHQKATLQEGEFSLVKDIPWVTQSTSLVWTTEHFGLLRSWGAESEIQRCVSNVLHEVIGLLGLTGVLKCYEELSIFRLRADIWIVVDATGVPIGVVEVKKPGKRIMQSERLHGQIYDYMLRLRSFHGLKHVFGIVSTYEEWRVYWLPECNEIAQSTSYRISEEERREELPDINEEEDVEDVEDDTDEDDDEWINKEEAQSRVVCGSRVFLWNDKDIVSMLGSVLLKMRSSPHETVNLIDSARPYIIMTEKEWIWAKPNFSSDFSLHYKKMPTRNTKKFLLLADFRGGADGRVWLACSMSGRVGVIKFAQQSTDIDSPPRERLAKELEYWQSINGFENCRIVELAGEPALLMPFARPVAEGGRKTCASDIPEEVRKLTVAAADKMAKKGVYHKDLHWGHIGVVSPMKRGESRRAIMYDLARVGEACPEKALKKMLKALDLSSDGTPKNI